MRKVIPDFNQRGFAALDPDYRGGPPRKTTRPSVGPNDCARPASARTAPAASSARSTCTATGSSVACASASPRATCAPTDRPRHGQPLDPLDPTNIRVGAANGRVELVPIPTYASYLNRIECHVAAIAEFVIKNAD